MVKYLYVMLLIMAAMTVQQVSGQKNLVSADGMLNDKFGKKLGNLLFSATALKFGRMKNNSIKTDTIRIFNSGSKAITLTLGKIPAHLVLSLKSPVIEPHAESWITCMFDAPKKNDYGFVLDRFELLTNDSLQAKKVLTVTATLEEAFSSMSGDDSIQSPRARWSETVFDFGSVRAGDKITHDFIVHNDGKKDLVIHKSKSSYGCLKTSFSKTTIAAGDSSVVKVEFDSFGKEGRESRKSDVYLNDFTRPDVTIEVKALVSK